MKFLALKVDFDGLSLDFLGSRKPAHEGIRERYPRKSRYFVLVVVCPDAEFGGTDRQSSAS